MDTKQNTSNTKYHVITVDCETTHRRTWSIVAPNGATVSSGYNDPDVAQAQANIRNRFMGL